jgi:hypothetical protein
MRISLLTRVARACAAATLVFSLSLAPSSARMGAPVGRPAFGPGHFSHFTPRGFNRRFDFDRFGFNRFDFNRFGPNRLDRFGFNRFNRFGFNRFNRFGFNRFGGNQLFVGGWGWGDWGGSGYWGGPVSVPTEQPAPIIIGGGPPVIVNIGAGAGRGDAGGAGYGGGCVTHKLIYDSDGKYVGERQTSQC